MRGFSQEWSLCSFLVYSNCSLSKNRTLKKKHLLYIYMFAQLKIRRKVKKKVWTNAKKPWNSPPQKKSQWSIKVLMIINNLNFYSVLLTYFHIIFRFLKIISQNSCEYNSKRNLSHNILRFFSFKKGGKLEEK